MANRHSPFYPIIYVRGYAMTRNEIDATTADPFCGFNLGSTVYRAVPDRTKPPRKYIFESPVLRLASDFDYTDVYEDGYDIMDDNWSADPDNKLGPRSIVIYRYYDEASTLLGQGETPSIDAFAADLGTLVLRVRDLVCGNAANGIAPDDFRCYLVAHSMGGLVCRAFLQNPNNDKGNARRYVDKLFTYATPHNGIDVAGLNVPQWLSVNDIGNFNRATMAKYLDLEEAYAKTKRVDWLPRRCFPAEKVFCMVGTNRLDYEAAAGASRTFVGHGSDGLVRIENATLTALEDDGRPGALCAKAFAYRAHSGYFGIVNSEEAYQNLTRFLFGDVRVDLWLDLQDIRLPPEVQQAADKGKKIGALYQIEALASTRGKLWFLTRRVTEEDSVACVTYEQWKSAPAQGCAQYLSSVFLANRARVNKRRRSLAYALQLGVRVPDYEVDNVLWFDKHYEGGYLFRDAIIVELTPPRSDDGKWKVQYAWQGQGFSSADTEIAPSEIAAGKIEVKIPFDSRTTPGVSGQVRFVVSAWN
jgi:hypothetical protein